MARTQVRLRQLNKNLLNAEQIKIIDDIEQNISVQEEINNITSTIKSENNHG